MYDIALYLCTLILLQSFPDNFISSSFFSLLTVYHPDKKKVKKRTLVVQKNVSQGCHKVRQFYNKVYFKKSQNLFRNF